MTEINQAYFERFVDAVNQQDVNAIAAMLHPEYIDEMPQTGERTRGVANYLATLANYPEVERLRDAIQEPALIGNQEAWVLTPSYSVVHVVGASDQHTVTARVTYPDGSLWHMVILVTIRDGLIYRTTSYYAPDLPAPEWRAQWVERID